MIKYKADYWRVSIEPVEIKRETAAFVFYDDDWRGVIRESREQKVTSSSSYHDTWEDAKLAIVRHWDQKLEASQRSLQAITEKHGQAKDLRNEANSTED